MLPFVSVLMTSYNREKYIAEAIESVLASTYTNFELIIVDDCSKDKTVEIAKSYENKDPRVAVFLNEKNLGDYENRNKAASYAKGQYIKYVDSDDAVYPWCLEAMYYCMKKFPDAGFGLMSNYISKSILPIALSPADAYRNFYFKGLLINMGPTGAIIKRDAFELVGGFSGKQFVGDTELWYKLSTKFSLVCMPSDLIWWRTHEEQQIKYEKNNHFNQFVRFKISIEALFNKDCPLSQSENNMAFNNTRSLYSRNIILLVLKGNFKRAIQLKSLAKIKVLYLLLALKKNKYPASL